MKRKEIKALALKTIVELKKDLEQKQTQLRKLVLEQKIKPAKNTRLRQIIRTDIARILTIIKQLQIRPHPLKT